MSNTDISTPQGVVSALHRIAEHDRTADLSDVRGAVDTIEADRRRAIVKSLQGVADLAVLGGSKGRHFVLAIWHDGQARTVEGVDYAYGAYIAEKDETKEYRVLTRDDTYRVGVQHFTMGRLKEKLNEAKIPYAIVYFDK